MTRPCDIQTKTNTGLCTDGGHGYSFHFRFPFLCFSIFLQSYKANRVQGGIRVNTGCCDVCGEWVTVCGGHSWYWASGAIFLFLSCRVRCFEKPGPPPRAHLLSHDNQTNGFHCSSQWPLTSELWVALQKRGCLGSLPGSITSFPPRAAKALSCLTPVARSPWAPAQLLLSSTYPHTMRSRLSWFVLWTSECSNNMFDSFRSYSLRRNRN